MTRFATLLIAMAIGLHAAAQTVLKAPLHPIEADSIFLMDFFWDGIQKRAIAADATPIKHSWTAKPLAPSKVAKLASKWDKAVGAANILGAPKGKADNLASAVKDFNSSWQLSLLTGRAQYVDMAERILANRILPMWLATPSAKGSKEACDILRTIDQMAYASSGHDVYINTLMRSNAHIQNADINIYLQTGNSSPWYYETSINFVDNMDSTQAMIDAQLNDMQRALYYNETQLDSSYVVFHIRLPQWATGRDMLPGHSATGKIGRPQIIVNGTLVKPEMKDGYMIVGGRWGVRDLISVRIPIQILRVSDEACPDRVALQRGPFVYAFTDVPTDAQLDVTAPINHEFSAEHQAIIFSGNWATGKGQTTFSALPYYISKPSATIFAPKK